MSENNDSRIEKLLKAILGQEVQLESRESRVERLLYAILTGGSHDEPTLSEMEDILLCILHGERYEGPTSSRINDMLKVKANGGSYDEPRLSRIEELIYEWINGGDISTYTGTLPATLQTVAGYLAGYKIWGNTGGVGNEAIVASLPEPLCGIDTHADELALSTGILTRRIKKLILDGTESWRATSGRVYLDTLLDDYMRASGIITCICTHYAAQEQVASASRVSEGCITLGSDPVSQRLYIYDTNISTTSDFKSYLAAQYAADTPVTMWYVLAEPETSTVTVPSGLTGTIEGYLVQDSVPSPENPIYPTANGVKNVDDTYSIQYGYKLPIISNDTATDIYIGDTQLAKDEYVDSETGQIYRYVDGILTPTDPPAPLPQIPTAAGETTIDYGAAALPHVTGLDGIFEYGNIDGLTWKNSVSDENDITFDTAVTDTGTEYVLPAGASGQYTSKSGEYRTEFTWYCIAKCPTTCHSAGQYMVSNWNNQGVEISSGWAAYSSAGTNHLVRSINNNDFNSAKTVTNYALIAVSGDVNGVASVYVNGEKMTDNWNFNPVSSSGAATIFLGKRASGQLSGTDIDYKFLAFGITKQTDSEIAANSQYLMTKYLGVGRPEKVELKYR